MIHEEHRGVRRATVLFFVGFCLWIGPVWFTAHGAAPQQESSDVSKTSVQLPDGAGKELIIKKCTRCHTLEKVTKEPRTEADWRNLLKIMVVQGMEITPEDNETALRYLLANFGRVVVPRKQQGSSTENSVQGISYSKDIAPILNKNCALCHHVGDIAPMSLLTFQEVRPWAASIRDQVVQRKMPPWHADPKVGEFSNDLRLTEVEIATIRAWVNNGAKEGDPKDLPPAPVFKDGWHIKPDVVLSIPEFAVSAANQDDYEFFFVPTNFAEDKWVQAAEVLPGDRRVVHHADALVVDGNKVEETQAKVAKRFELGNDKYQYSTGRVRHIKPDAPVVDDGCSMPEGGGLPGHSSGTEKIEPAIYLPGHLAEARPTGYAIRIPAGAYIMFAVHYSNRLGEAVKDHTSLGLVFSNEPVKHEMAEYDIENMLFKIPSNADNHRVTSCFTLPKDEIAVALTAHMHYRGKSMTTEALYPDGRREVLLDVPHYDFRWQETYFLKHQFLLPKGTKLVTTAYFDNSANNPLNPDPSKAIRFGEPSDEEMMGFWLHFADPQPVDTKPEIARAKH